MTMLSKFTSELIDLIYIESKKKRNKKKIDKIIYYITSCALENIQPYLILIISLLIILFLMNCFQFYYYIKKNRNF